MNTTIPQLAISQTKGRDAMGCSTNPLTAPIFEHISTADAHQLLNIRSRVIPHCIGITDDEREGLQESVRERFCQLNAEAISQFEPRTFSK